MLLYYNRLCTTVKSKSYSRDRPFQHSNERALCKLLFYSSIDMGFQQDIQFDPRSIIHHLLDY